MDYWIKNDKNKAIWYYSQFKEWSFGSIEFIFIFIISIFLNCLEDIKSITKSQFEIFNEKQQWKVHI